MAGFEKLVKRSDKIPFAKVKSATAETYTRFRGLSEFAQSKNPVEYPRQYIDEATERTDVVGYAPEISFDFDEYEDNTIQQSIAEMFDKELLGDATHIYICIVNLTKEATPSGSYKAVQREYAVIPSDEGGETDRYNYTGSLKAVGSPVFGKATTTDGWETATFTADTE